MPRVSDDSIPLVVHIIHELGTGGLENGLINIINRTPRDRVRHVIICLTHATEFSQRIESDDVKVFELNKREGQDFGLYYRLLKLLWTLKPDVVHTRNLSALEMQAIAFLVPGAKRVHGEHGRDIYDLDGSNRKYNALRKVMRFFVHRYIAVSQDLEQWLLDTVAVSPKKVVQIYNGVDHARFSSSSSVAEVCGLPEEFGGDDLIIIGTVGRAAAVKNQISLLEAFELIRKNEPLLAERLRLIIVGDGPEFKSLEAKVADAQLQDSVWLAGNRNDIPELLKNFDIFVLPSLGEGISNTILEAMSCRLPIIATNVGGNPELVNETNGILVPVDDSERLANAIVTLAKDDQQRERLATESLARVTSEFCWNRTVDRYLSIYEELSARR